jgi:hypothetical protein
MPSSANCDSASSAFGQRVVTVARIVCLARSTFDPFSIFKRIADAGGGFRSLA